MRLALGLAAGALLLVGTTTTFAQQTPGATADVKNATGASIGTATFTQETTGVHLRAQLKGLPVGLHGIHIHAVGKCDAPDFMTAGGHFNPAMHQHGLDNPQGAHAGDMPNLAVASDGSANLDFLLKDVSLGTATGSLFGPDGTALVIHADQDDEKTDPTGNSGARIACGVINRVAGAPVAQPSPSTGGPLPPAPSPAAKPSAPATAAQPSPAAKPAAPVQAPAAMASPSALPRTGSALPLGETALPAALTGLGALVVGGLALWRRRR